MPNYEYKCSDCGAKFEQVNSFAKMDWGVCPCCDSGQTKRKFSVTSQFIIPLAFRSVLQGFQGAPGPDSAPYSNNNSVHAPKRQSFTEAFDANYKKAGGIG